MRHRQSTGAGPFGARPGALVLGLMAAGLVVALTAGGSAGLWTAYFIAMAAAVIGALGLWSERGNVERRAKELARRSRVELDRAATTEQQHRGEVERLKAELEHEQQYSSLVQAQLGRARRQLEDERAARRAAERELDTLAAWKAAIQAAMASSAQQSALFEGRAAESGRPVPPVSVDPRLGQPYPAQAAAVDEQGDYYSSYDVDASYQPYPETPPATAVVSDAALAMAPVIGYADADAVLDLTAYDETVEFSVRDLRRRA